jgi:hypothetical protein
MKIFSVFALGAAVLASPSLEAIAAPICESGKGYVAADISQQVNGDFLDKIKSIGINTVIRYYDWKNETLPGKTLTRLELELIASKDMNLAVVFQHNNDCLCTFMDGRRGNIDAQRALELAKSFDQPPGSAIYFGVDGVDAQFLELLRGSGLSSDVKYADGFIHNYIRSYFTNIKDNLVSKGYKIGVYGSGKVCADLLDMKLVDFCWLANATNWPGYNRFEKTKKWILKQQLPTTDCFGLELDLNVGDPANGTFGQWKPVR